MKRALLFVTTSILAIAISACSKDDSASDKGDQSASAKTEAQSDVEKADKEAIGELSVDQLDGLMSDDSANVAVLDSNGVSTRKKYGKIPGATLLSDYQSFEASELPEDKDCKLVFYCSNTHCGASHASAKIAMAEGYKDVNVLPVGIKGWKEAGKKTETVQ